MQRRASTVKGACRMPVSGNDGGRLWEKGVHQTRIFVEKNLKDFISSCPCHILDLVVVAFHTRASQL